MPFARGFIDDTNSSGSSLIETKHAPHVNSKVLRFLRLAGQRVELSQQLRSIEQRRESVPTATEGHWSNLGSTLGQIMRLSGGATDVATPLVWKVAPVVFAFYVWSFLASHGEKTLRVLEKADTVGSLIAFFVIAVVSVFSLRTIFFGVPRLRLSDAAINCVISVADPAVVRAAKMGVPDVILGLVSVLFLMPLAAMVGSTAMALDLLFEAIPVLLVISPVVYYLWTMICRYLSPSLMHRLQVVLGRSTMFSILCLLLWLVATCLFL